MTMAPRAIADTILSPATAKNVITVGAIEQFRNITNQVWKCTATATNVVQHEPAVAGHDRFQQPGGRLLQPRAMWASASKANMAGSSPTWSRRARLSSRPARSSGTPTPITTRPAISIFVYPEPGGHYQRPLVPKRIYVPDNAVQLNLTVGAQHQFARPVPRPAALCQQADPADQRHQYDAVGTNSLSLPPDRASEPRRR